MKVLEAKLDTLPYSICPTDICKVLAPVSHCNAFMTPAGNTWQHIP